MENASLPVRTCAAGMSIKRRQHRKVSLTMMSCLGRASAGKAQHQTKTANSKDDVRPLKRNGGERTVI